VSYSSLAGCSFWRVTVRDTSRSLNSTDPSCCSTRERAMLTSPAWFSSWLSSSASTRAISTRSAGAEGSRPGGTAAAAIRRWNVGGAARVGALDTGDAGGSTPGAGAGCRAGSSTTLEGAATNDAVAENAVEVNSVAEKSIAGTSDSGITSDAALTSSAGDSSDSAAASEVVAAPDAAASDAVAGS